MMGGGGGVWAARVVASRIMPARASQMANFNL